MREFANSGIDLTRATVGLLPDENGLHFSYNMAVTVMPG